MKHHFVPQFLLRAWRSEHDHRVEVFRTDIKGIPSSRMGPRYVGQQEDLYALTKEFVAGMERQAIEKQFLRNVDNAGARVHSTLLAEGFRKLGAQDREDWVRFLMSLRVRHPSVVALLKATGEDHLRRSLMESPAEYQAVSDPSQPATLEEWVELRLPGLIENFGMACFHELAENAEVGNRLLQMKWWIWDFSGLRQTLLLADEPCIFTGSINDPTLVVALPLSPRKVFMASQSEQIHQRIREQTKRDLVERINESTVSQARARIFAMDDTSSRFIRNRLRLRH